MLGQFLLTFIISVIVFYSLQYFRISRPIKTFVCLFMCLFQQERAIREHQHGIITFIFIINLSIIVTSPHLCCSPNHFHIKHTVESSLISVSVWDKRTLTHSLLLLFPPTTLSLYYSLCLSLRAKGRIPFILSNWVAAPQLRTFCSPSQDVGKCR